MRLQRVRAEFQMIASIRCERISGHANQSRVLDGASAGNAVSGDPIQVLADLVQHVDQDVDVLREVRHGVAQSLGGQLRRGRWR